MTSPEDGTATPAPYGPRRPGPSAPPPSEALTADRSRRWKVLAVTAAALFIVFLDSTVVNIAFPAMRRSFAPVSDAGLAWVITSYLVVFAALLLVAGRLADLFGRRRTFHLGLGVFVAGSILAGLAPDLPLLIAARCGQAVGAALIVPASLALLLPEFPPSQRSTAVGLWGAAGALSAAAGPTAGALLVSGPGWRWVFLLNLPVGLLTYLAGRRLLRESSDPAATRPDILGTVLLAAGLGALSLAVSQGTDWGWTSSRVLVAFAAAAVLLPVFVARSAGHRSPALDLDLFRSRPFTIATAITVLFSAAFFAVLLANVLFLTGVWGYGELRAGLAITPSPLIAAVLSGPAGAYADKHGHRSIVVAGSVLVAAGTVYFALRVDASPAYLSDWLPGALLLGAGVGLAISTVGAAAVATLSPARFGAGSAVGATARQLGGIAGVSALVAVLSTADPGAGALPAHRLAWLMIAASALLAAAGAVGLPRGRTRVPAEQTAAASPPHTPPASAPGPGEQP